MPTCVYACVYVYTGVYVCGYRKTTFALDAALSDRPAEFNSTSARCRLLLFLIVINNRRPISIMTYIRIEFNATRSGVSRVLGPLAVDFSHNGWAVTVNYFAADLTIRWSGDTAPAKWVPNWMHSIVITHLYHRLVTCSHLFNPWRNWKCRCNRLATGWNKSRGQYHKRIEKVHAHAAFLTSGVNIVC